jgi:RimJ/RimL family protein N-acetyltransferase
VTDVRLRDVIVDDLPTFFEHQRDPDATRMAAFVARDREAFMAHWTTRVLGDATAVKQTVLVDGRVAGNVVCWWHDGQRLIGYWIGREFWGRGVATAALGRFVELVPTRPLRAHVAVTNAGSIRVLEKCGFVLVGREMADVEELVYELVDRAG